MALRWLLPDPGEGLGGSGTSKQNGSELCTGCRMTKITMGIVGKFTSG